jgi:hypothetical protein
VADLFDHSVEVENGLELQPALAKTTPADNVGLELVMASKVELFPDIDLSSRMNQAFPFIRLPRDLPGQQHLDPTGQKVPCSPIAWADRLGFAAASPPVQPGRKYPGIVKHHQVIGSKQGGKVPETPIPANAGAALEVQQAGGGSLGQRFLGNQFSGKMVMKLGEAHGVSL